MGYATAAQSVAAARRVAAGPPIQVYRDERRRLIVEATDPASKRFDGRPLPRVAYELVRDYPGAAWAPGAGLVARFPGDAGPTLARLFEVVAPEWPSAPPLNPDRSELPLRRPQQLALDFYGRRSRALVALPPSAGKTRVGLIAGETFGAGCPVLVICPNAARGVWRDECRRWLPNSRPLLLAGRDPARFFEHRFRTPDGLVSGVELFARATHLIVHYDVVAGWVGALLDRSRGPIFAVADEIHNIRNTTSRRSRGLFGDVEDAVRLTRIPHKLALTGTPLLNRPLDLYAPFDWLNPGWVGTFARFARRYAQADSNDFGTRYYGVNTDYQEELRERFGEIAFRMDKEEALAGLPPKVREIVRVEIGDELARKPLRVGDLGLDLRGLKLELALRNWTRALRRAGRGKVPYTIQQARALCVDPDSKWVVYAYAIRDVEWIARALAKTYDRVYCVHAKAMPSGERRKEVADAFCRFEGSAAFVASMEAVRESLDLSAADGCVFNDLDYVPGKLIQWEDRVSRLGRTTPARIYYMVAERTIDEVVIDYVLRKLGYLDAVEGGDAEKTSLRGVLEGTESDEDVLRALGDRFAAWRKRAESEDSGCDWDNCKGEVDEDADAGEDA